MVMVDGSAGVGFRAIHWPATGTPNTARWARVDVKGRLAIHTLLYYVCSSAGRLRCAQSTYLVGSSVAMQLR